MRRSFLDLLSAGAKLSRTRTYYDAAGRVAWQVEKHGENGESGLITQFEDRIGRSIGSHIESDKRLPL